MSTDPSNPNRYLSRAPHLAVVKDEPEEAQSLLTDTLQRKGIRAPRSLSHLEEEPHERNCDLNRLPCQELSKLQQPVSSEDNRSPAIRRAMDALQKAQLSLKDALSIVDGAVNQLDDENQVSSEDLPYEEEIIDCNAVPSSQSASFLRSSVDDEDDAAYERHRTQILIGKQHTTMESVGIAPVKMSSRGMVRTGNLPKSNEYVRAIAQVGMLFISKRYCKCPPKCQSRRRAFKHDLWEFNKERGRKTRVRVLSKNAIDHFDVFCEVLELGGFEASVAALGMNYICRRLGYGNASKSSIGSNLKTIYLDDLFHYEQVLVHGREPDAKRIAELQTNSYEYRVKVLRRDSRREN